MKWLLNLSTREVVPFYLTDEENPHEFMGQNTMAISDAQVKEMMDAHTTEEKDAIIKRIVTDRFMSSDLKSNMTEAEQEYIRKTLNEGREAAAKLAAIEKVDEAVEKSDDDVVKLTVEVKPEGELLTLEQVKKLPQAKLVDYCRNVLKWEDVGDNDPASILKARILEKEGFKK